MGSEGRQHNKTNAEWGDYLCCHCLCVSNSVNNFSTQPPPPFFETRFLCVDMAVLELSL